MAQIQLALTSAIHFFMPGNQTMVAEGFLDPAYAWEMMTL
jgi:hypothetical protein